MVQSFVMWLELIRLKGLVLVLLLGVKCEEGLVRFLRQEQW